MERTHRFARLETWPRAAACLRTEVIVESAQGIALWLEAAVRASGSSHKCCRNVLYHEDGRATWLYPNSNTAELISAWLELAELLDQPSLVENARRYADGMLDDPHKGLYRGLHREAWGIPWYWTDCGTYAGHYAMRLPCHFHRLHIATGEERYLTICDEVGQTLLQRQCGSGIVSAAWEPSEGWIPEKRVGSRYFLAIGTFATLWHITGDQRYHAAYERALEALLKAQNEDGSFFQVYHPETAEPLDASLKLHFASYLFNGLEEAYEITREPGLIDCARRMADHLLGVFYYRHTLPYCTGEVSQPPDQMEAESAVQDSSKGLLWLARQTGEGSYHDVAVKLWMDAWLNQLPNDREPGWSGAILRGVQPGVKATPIGVPENRRHLHHDPSVIARCDLWFVIHHALAARRLFKGMQNPAKSGDDAPDNLD